MGATVNNIPTSGSGRTKNVRTQEQKRCTCGWEYPRFLEVEWLTDSAMDRAEYWPEVAIEKGLAVPLLRADEVLYCPSCARWIGPPGGCVDLSRAARTRNRREFLSIFVDLVTQPKYVGPLPPLLIDLAARASSAAARLGSLTLIVTLAMFGTMSWLLGSSWLSRHGWWPYFAAGIPVVLGLLVWRRVDVSVSRYLYAKKMARRDIGMALQCLGKLTRANSFALILCLGLLLLISVVLVLVPNGRSAVQSIADSPWGVAFLAFSLYVLVVAAAANDDSLRSDMANDYEGRLPD